MDEDILSRDVVSLEDGINIKELTTGGTTFTILDENLESMNKEYHMFSEESLRNLKLGVDESSEDEIADKENDNLPQFERLALSMKDITGDRGVLKKVKIQGTGDAFKLNHTVTFHYSSFLEDVDEPFDSTKYRGRPHQSVLGSGDLIPGLDIALQTMRPKESSVFLLKPNYAYGKLGVYPRIPGDATIYCEVTAIDSKDYSGIEELKTMSYGERLSLPFEKKIENAKTFHGMGNDCVKAERYTKAKIHYKDALQILESANAPDEKASSQQCELLARLHSNLAWVCVKLKENERACRECQHALDLPGTLKNNLHAKILYRYAHAKMALHDFKHAWSLLKKAKRFQPHSEEIFNFEEKLALEEKRIKEIESVMCKNIFRSANNSPPSKESSPKKEFSETGCTDSYLKNIDVQFQVGIQEQLDDLVKGSIYEIKLPYQLTDRQKSFVEDRVCALGLQMNFVGGNRRKFYKITKM